MKKILSAAFFCLFSLCLFALDGIVESVSGKVEMQTGNSDWVTLNKGDLVPAGAVISTGFKAQADIKLGGSLLTVKQLSRVTLNDLTETSDTVYTDIYLDAGSVHSDVKPLNNKANGYKVRTSAVTSSVRGTVFDCVGRTNGVSTVSIQQGCVENVMANGEVRTARGGESIKIVEGHMSSTAANANDGVDVENPVCKPSDKATSPLQIVCGDLDVSLPDCYMSDNSSSAAYETSLYGSSTGISFK